MEERAVDGKLAKKECIYGRAHSAYRCLTTYGPNTHEKDKRIMAHVVVRVELHGGTDAQYQLLHTKMFAAGFTRTILGGDGSTYNLPTAMYYSNNYATPTLARAAAWGAATGVTPSYAVIAAGTEVAWQGLAKV